MPTPIPSLKLSPKREYAAGLIAKGKTQAETARDPQINVTKQTMNVWCQDPDFVQRVNELRTDPVKQAEEKLDIALPHAIDTIVEITTSKPTDENGNPIDYRFITSKLKAALWIAERKLTKKLPVKKETTDGVFIEDADDEEIDKLLSSVNGE